MISTTVFGEMMKSFGFNFYSGVPCSFLKSLINYATCESFYVPSTNEGDAVATCFGATLGGAKSVVLMQNSGLANAVSPLTSLNFPFRVPVLGFVSLRGAPNEQDEPQHELMGRITTDLLEAMEVSWEYLSADMKEAQQQLGRADAALHEGKTFFFVVKKGTFDEYALREQRLPHPVNATLQGPTTASVEAPRRSDVLEALARSRKPNTVILGTTGVTGRELYQLAHHDQNFYMVGSMGCVGSIGLGLALHRPDLEVIAVDGDGALLMRMGSLAANAAMSPRNMFHVVLDNAVHESTGCQPTASSHVKFGVVAASCGYRRSYDLNSEAELLSVLAEWRENPELAFVRLVIQPGHLDPLARPVEPPYELVRRLMSSVGAPLPLATRNASGSRYCRNVLFTPGPATTTLSVKLAQVFPDVSPRTVAFNEFVQKIRLEITSLVANPNTHETVLFGGSGTAAVEAMVSSVGALGEQMLIINNGAYGNRMCEIASAASASFDVFVSNPCLPLDLSELERALVTSKSPVRWVAVVHHETTTGLLNDVAAVGSLAHKYGARILVDAMSSFAALPIDMPEMNIAFLASSSNKNIQGMAGASFVVSETQALNSLKDARPKSFYLDLYKEAFAVRTTKQSRFTPPVQALFALKAALEELSIEGVEQRFSRYSSNCRALLDGALRLGFKPLVKWEECAKILVSLLPPEGSSYDFFDMQEYFSDRSIVIYEGKLTNINYVRLSTIGDIQRSDVELFLELLEAYSKRWATRSASALETV